MSELDQYLNLIRHGDQGNAHVWTKIRQVVACSIGRDDDLIASEAWVAEEDNFLDR